MKPRKINLTEATLTPEEKMHDWHNGLRNENVKACSDQKLQTYYDICLRHKYTDEVHILQDEAHRRGLPKLLPTIDPNRALSEFNFKHARDLTESELIFYWKNTTNASFDFGFDCILYLLALGRKDDALDFNNRFASEFNLFDGLKGLILKETRNTKIMQQIANFMDLDEALEVNDKLDITEEAFRNLVKLENEQAPLCEAPEKHDTLNPKLWDIETNELKPEVKEKIMAIVDDFCNDLKENEIKFNLKDVKLVGSNCSYNYNDNSDLDVHLVMETNSLHCPDDLYPLLYSAYRSIWNKNHDVSFYGIPVEIFVETDDTEQLNDATDNLKEARQQTALKSNGIYSVLNDEWIKEPVIADIPDIDDNAFEKLLDEWENRYFEIKDAPTKEAIEKFIEDIYELRRTSIANDGEYSLGNLVFKECRNLGYLDGLRDLKKELINKELSLD